LAKNNIQQQQRKIQEDLYRNLIIVNSNYR